MDAKPYVPVVDRRNALSMPYPPPKEWMARRDGELPHEHMRRLNHTCYHCGVYLEDLGALDAHESEHGKQSD